MKNLSTKIGQVITGAVIFVLSINFAIAQKAKCACADVAGYKVTFDNCALNSAGFCAGWCGYKAINTQQTFDTDWNCVKVGGAGGVKPAGIQKEKISLYDYNSSLSVEIGTPTSIENEVSVALNLDGTNGTIMKYDIFNSFGQVIKTDLKLAAGSSLLKIDTKDLSAGIYSLKFEVNGQIINRTFKV